MSSIWARDVLAHYISPFLLQTHWLFLDKAMVENMLQQLQEK